MIIFHVFDPSELEFPFKKLTDFHDMETDERYQVDPKAIRNEYLDELRAFIDNYKRICSDSDIEYVLADTSVPYDFMLTSYLSKRRKFR
ncbi:MAG: hypothetical protein QF662_05050 [Phycisphaerae bacterium]|nr:hypothetical protein [Phycisphaerae bacterium]